MRGTGIITDLDRYATLVNDTFRSQIKNGLSPLQRDQSAEQRYLPYNPKTHQSYRGINALWLAALETAHQFPDNRWLTEGQAVKLGGTLASDAVGAQVVHWQMRRLQPVLDSRGRPQEDRDGRPLGKYVKLEKPLIWSATVFNACQIVGLDADAAQAVVPAEEHITRLSTLMGKDGIVIDHQAGAAAHYSPVSDTITLPPLQDYPSAADYCAALFQGFIRATGHSSRFNRDLSHPVGSMATAREELLVHMASYLGGDHLKIGYSADTQDAYAPLWSALIAEDPRVLFRTAQVATTLLERTPGLEYGIGQQTAQTLQSVVATVAASTPTLPGSAAIIQEPMPLVTPGAARDSALSRGGQVGQDNTVYAPAGAPLEDFRSWTPAAAQVTAPDIESPRQAFLRATQDMGLMIKDLIDDGLLHRVPVDGDHGSERSGAYRYHPDGRPAGFIENHRTAQRMNWKFQGALEKVITRATVSAEAAQQRKQREEQATYIRKIAAQTAQAAWDLCDPATDDHPYLQNKQVRSHGLRIVSPEATKLINAYTAKVAESLHEEFKPLRITGNLLVPIHSAQGEITSLQNISRRGFKAFMKQAQFGQGSFLIGTISANKPIIVAEGYATGATIHEKKGLPVVIAFNADNIKHVAAIYRSKYPDHTIILAGDNDHQNPKELDPRGKPKLNKGKLRAEEAAKNIDGHALLPSFSPDDRGSDWNDLWTSAPAVAEHQWQAGMDHALMLATGRAFEQQLQTQQAELQQANEIQQPLEHAITL